MSTTTPKERLQRITGFVSRNARRIWDGMDQQQRIWTVIWSVVVVVAIFLGWGAAGFPPFNTTRADRCYNAVMYYWDIDTFSPMVDHNAYEALEPETWEIFEDTIGADGIPAREIAREQCEEVYG